MRRPSESTITTSQHPAGDELVPVAAQLVKLATLRAASRSAAKSRSGSGGLGTRDRTGDVDIDASARAGRPR